MSYGLSFNEASSLSPSQAMLTILAKQKEMKIKIINDLVVSQYTVLGIGHTLNAILGGNNNDLPNIQEYYDLVYKGKQVEEKINISKAYVPTEEERKAMELMPLPMVDKKVEKLKQVMQDELVKQLMNANNVKIEYKKGGD